jgi:hypothetical protein
MHNLYLPGGHTKADVELAKRVVVALDARALFVCWSLSGRYLEPSWPPVRRRQRKRPA